MSKIIIYLLLMLFVLGDCASGFRTKKLVYSTAKSAFYEFEVSEIPDNNLLKGKILHPYKITVEKLSAIIGTIKFEKTTRIIKMSDYVFHDRELADISPDIVQLLENIDNKHVGVIISQYDHIQSVISNKKRTSFYIWVDDEGLNLVFGDIQNGVSREDTVNFYDWTRIEPIQLTVKPDENEIPINPLYKFKKVKGYSNRKWLVFSLADLSKYNPRSGVVIENPKE